MPVKCHPFPVTPCLTLGVHSILSPDGWSVDCFQAAAKPLPGADLHRLEQASIFVGSV
jgi:hypothetical protein